MRFIPRLDNNQKEIVEKLRKLGYSVLSLAQLGGGILDLLVGCSKGNVLLEVKNPDRLKKRGAGERETADRQAAFVAAWKGPAYIVFSFDEALFRIKEYEADR